MISVVIPVYNRATLVGRAVRSVLDQTFSDREILVVDDGSTDGTPDLVRREFGSQITLLEQSANNGVSSARNRGIRESKGEWLALLDSDDEWLPTKLEKQTKALRQSQLSISHTDEMWIRNGVRVNPHKRHQKFGGDIFLKSLPLCAMSPSSILFHRDVISKMGFFDETLPACEDYDLFLRVTLHYPVCYVDEKLVAKYGGHADQLSRAHPAMDRFRVQTLNKLLIENPEMPARKRDAVLATLIEKAAIVVNGARKRGNLVLEEEMENYLSNWA